MNEIKFSILQNPNSWDEGNQGANKCSDFDNECVEVEDKCRCYLGGTYDIGMADGYCPFVIKMQ